MTAFEMAPADDREAYTGIDPLAEHDRLTAECAARSGGHRWQVCGEPEEHPYLSCEDCPASADELIPDALDVLEYYGPVPIGQRTVVFGQELPADAEPYAIPVDARVETTRNPYCDYGTEYDIEIHLAERGDPPAVVEWALCDYENQMMPVGHACKGGGPPSCPTPEGNPCGTCPADLAAQVSDPRYGPQPNTL